MKQISDKEFVESVIMQRMELCYSRWKSRKNSDKKAIGKYIDSMFDDASEEENFFYRAGIRDGFNLYCKILEIQESGKLESTAIPK